jgi:diamine N-acetyltransferase
MKFQEEVTWQKTAWWASAASNSIQPGNMNENFEIRTAHKGDIATIEQLARQVWPHTYGNILTQDQLNYMLDHFYSPAAIENQMTRLNHHFIISILDNKPVGFASWSPADQPGVYKLHKLYVLTSTQGKGIGKKLVDYIQEKLQACGASSLKLNVNRYNKARIFYENLGFVIIGEEDVHIGNGVFQNDFVMEKKFTRPS